MQTFHVHLHGSVNCPPKGLQLSQMDMVSGLPTAEVQMNSYVSACMA